MRSDRLSGPDHVLGDDWLTGGDVPAMLTHSYVAVTELAVRNAAVGPFPSPAAFPLQARPALIDFVQAGVPTKCGLSA